MWHGMWLLFSLLLKRKKERNTNHIPASIVKAFFSSEL
jgi:hypothetical protein